MKKLTLAEKYSGYRIGKTNSVVSFYKYIAFLAGSKKTAELASQLVAESWNNTKYQGKPHEKAVKLIAEDILLLIRPLA